MKNKFIIITTMILCILLFQPLCFGAMSIRKDTSAINSTQKLDVSKIWSSKFRWFKSYSNNDLVTINILDSKTSVKNIYLSKSSVFDYQFLGDEIHLIQIDGETEDIGDMMIVGDPGDWGIFKIQESDEYIIVIFILDNNIKLDIKSRDYISNPIIYTDKIMINRVKLTLDKLSETDIYEEYEGPYNKYYMNDNVPIVIVKDLYSRNIYVYILDSKV